MSTEKRYRFSHVERLIAEHHDLGLVDSKGRKIGAIAYVYLNEVFEFEVHDDPRKNYWCDTNDPEAAKHPVGSRHIFASVQAARNGRSYGASQRAVYIGPDGDKRTDQALAVHVAKRLVSMKKRYAAEVEHKKRYGMTRGQRR